MGDMKLCKICRVVVACSATAITSGVKKLDSTR